MGHVDHNRVRQLAAEKLTDVQIGAIVGCHPGYARLIRTGAVKRRGEGGTDQSRKESKPLMGRRSPGMPPFDHPAIMGLRTIFPSLVREPDEYAVLKSGYQHAKIGKRITRGKWKGFEIYTLTLEERATCPRDCQLLRSCYGNNLQFAVRYRHGPRLEARLAEEVKTLAAKHPGGFAVRLHILGEFYSVEYVALWARLLDLHPALHVFGFTARHDVERDPIAAAVLALTNARRDRFNIRRSNAAASPWATSAIEHPYARPRGSVVCPSELGKVANCASCGFCWSSPKLVCFIRH